MEPKFERPQQEIIGPQWRKPTLEEEEGEFEGASEATGIPVSVLVDVFSRAELEVLRDEDWERLRNGTSRDTSWTLEESIAHIEERNRTQGDLPRDIHSIIHGFQHGETLPAPTVLFVEGEAPFLVGGNTRLLVARGLHQSPKVLALRLKR